MFQVTFLYISMTITHSGRSYSAVGLSSVLTNQPHILNKVPLNKNSHKTSLCVDPLMKMFWFGIGSFSVHAGFLECNYHQRQELTIFVYLSRDVLCMYRLLLYTYTSFPPHKCGHTIDTIFEFWF